MTGPRARLVEARERLADHYIPELLIALVAAGSLLFGVAIAADDDITRARSFAVTFAWLETWWWSVAFVGTGAALGVAGALRRSAAVPAALFTAGVWSLFAVATTLSAILRDGYLTAPVVYSIVSGLCLTTALAATGQRGRP